MTIYTDNEELLTKFPGFYRPIEEAYSGAPTTEKKEDSEKKDLVSKTIISPTAQKWLMD
jgi:hypothetical protein